MKTCCEQGLRKIEEKGYVQGMRAKGYEDITVYGIAFYGKGRFVREP